MSRSRNSRRGKITIGGVSFNVVEDNRMPINVIAIVTGKSVAAINTDYGTVVVTKRTERMGDTNAKA